MWNELEAEKLVEKKTMCNCILEAMGHGPEEEE